MNQLINHLAGLKDHAQLVSLGADSQQTAEKLFGDKASLKPIVVNEEVYHDAQMQYGISDCCGAIVCHELTWMFCTNCGKDCSSIL